MPDRAFVTSSAVTWALTHASWFSGVGGMDIGLERAGWRTVSFSEVDPYASAVLAERWPGVPNLGDVLRLAAGPQRVPAVVGSDDAGVDDEDWRNTRLWTAGFPCTDLSVAGKRAGFHHADGSLTRSGLALAFLRLLERHRPECVLLENVPGLLSSHRGKDLGTLLGALGELRYGWAFRVLDAQWFGVPQRRRRVFILALDLERHPDERSAGEVLAVGSRCGRDHPAERAAWARAAGTTESGPHIASTLGANDGKGTGFHRDDKLIIRSSDGEPGPDGQEVYQGHLVARPINTQRGHYDPDTDNYIVVDGAPPHPGGGNLDGELEHGTLAGAQGEAEWALRELRRAEVGGSPRQRGLARQLTGELEAALSELSQPGPRQAEAMHRLWAATEGVGLLREALPAVQDVGRPVDGETEPAHPSWTVRRLTPTECERLQGWPDGWTVARSWSGFKAGSDPDLPLGLDSHRYRCVGNGVAAPVAQWIGERLAQYLAQEDAA